MSKSRYKISKEAMNGLFAAYDEAMKGRYHQQYESMGVKKVKGSATNFHCWNGPGHSDGYDSHGSMSIDNERGVWNCKACGISGNTFKFFRDWYEGSNAYENSYVTFMIESAGLSRWMKISTDESGVDFEQMNAALTKFWQMAEDQHFQKTGKRNITAAELNKIDLEEKTIPMSKLDEHVARLLATPDKLAYFKETRNIDESIIKKYRLGLDEKGRYVFPMISAPGELINMKLYDPFCTNSRYKWIYPYKGYKTIPTPQNNFTYQKLYFFEGEPDLYCAISLGIPGAVTMGPCAVTDIDNVFGADQAKQIFLNKEIVICLDADGPGRAAAKKLAHSLYKYAKQIKIVDLDKSDINPKGLDPELTKEVTDEEGQVKKKRVETDFTDFARKNGLNENAKGEFDSVVDATLVYTENDLRGENEVYKVALHESRMSKYYSPASLITLEVIASVSNFDCNSYMYPTEFKVSCPMMGKGISKIPSMCQNCTCSNVKPDFENESSLTFHFTRGAVPADKEKDLRWTHINEHDILGLIEVTDTQKQVQQKHLAGINSRCSSCRIHDRRNEKLSHVKLSRDISDINDSSSASNADIDVDGYMIGDKDIEPNKSYRFTAVQTTAWSGQYAVLFINSAEQITTAIDEFRMNKQAYDLLQVFSPKQGEDISDCLGRKYKAFSNAAGISGREDLFFACDLAWHSPTEIRNKKLLPGISRGWVEILIAGDSRCGKSMAVEFLHKHYKMGEIIAASNAVSRSGLIGGMESFKNKSSIRWGCVPMNDKGLLIIDEMSNLAVEQLDNMTPSRSSGIAEINLSKRGKTFARTRKIMLSNPRVWLSEDKTESQYGIKFLKNLCGKDAILARFDYAQVVRQTDVDVSEFSSSYESIATEFTEMQCQTLIRWIYSRGPEDVVFEDGVEEHINKYQVSLMEQFHHSTQLINAEMRAKLVRMSVSLASMLFSIAPGDWNKIFVTKEHVDYIVNFLKLQYCKPNMMMHEYSRRMFDMERLGDMRFIRSVVRYIDIQPLFQEDEFSERALQQIFYDYLEKVVKRVLYIVDANNDSARGDLRNVSDGIQKLIGILVARKCFTRTKRGTYKKTAMFNNWLSDVESRMKNGESATEADILELTRSESGAGIIQVAKAIMPNA